MVELKSPRPVAEIPFSAESRERIREFARQHLGKLDLCAPVSLAELQEEASRILRLMDLAPSQLDFVTVVVANVVWEEALAAIPYDRRILIIPQCLRDRSSCPAKIDEFGLLCESCGRCPTGELQDRAEALGYVVLVAEGTTVVTQLIESGQVDGVVGVSCLATLERSFPYMTESGTPGIAIPLIKDGCDSTEVDLAWVREAIDLHREGEWTPRIDLDLIKTEVATLFGPQSLETRINLHGTQAERIACEWLAEGGKRWRPVLTSAVASALGTTSASQNADSTMLESASLAVECFHKASLVHDDIEDDDAERYGQPTLHRRYGVPIALNVGDLLIGEGYRLIAESGAGSDAMGQMLQVAASGHRELCLGQGSELAWTQEPGVLSVDQVVDIFARKTAPAFEVALRIGAICGGLMGQTPESHEVHEALRAFSRALGVAYQIRDDIEDFKHGTDVVAMRPSLLVALAMAAADPDEVAALEEMLSTGCWSDDGQMVRECVVEYGLEARAWRLFEEFKAEALRSLAPIRHRGLKTLLFRVVFKVLKHRPEIGTERPQAGQDGIGDLPMSLTS